MGGQETKIVHETVDKTNPRSRELGRQAAREENAELVRQLEEELQQQREREISSALENVRLENEQDANARAEAKRRRAELEAENLRREKENQEKLACLKMKEELLVYKFGNKLTLKTFEAEELDVSDMKRVVIALFGPTGSGKTSFIGTVERTLLGSEKQTAFEQGAGAEGTVLLQEYLSALNINLLDTRGFWEINDDTATECLNVMTGRTRRSDFMARKYDTDELEAGAEDHSTRRAAKFTDRVHAVIFVVQANDKRLKDGAYLDRMKKIRDHFRFEGHSPITVITCKDKIKSDEEREIAFREASAATGSPIDRTYFITNYTSQNKEYSLQTEKKAVDILDTALLSTERFVKIQKLREEHHGSSSGASSSSASATKESLKHFFKRLQAKYEWNNDRVTTAIQKLEEMEINTVDVLKESWDDIKKEVKMTIGMKRGVEKALKGIK